MECFRWRTISNGWQVRHGHWHAQWPVGDQERVDPRPRPIVDYCFRRWLLVLIRVRDASSVERGRVWNMAVAVMPTGLADNAYDHALVRRHAVSLQFFPGSR